MVLRKKPSKIKSYYKYSLNSIFLFIESVIYGSTIRLDMSIHHVTKSNLICDVVASAIGLESLRAFFPQMPETVVSNLFLTGMA